MNYFTKNTSGEIAEFTTGFIPSHWGEAYFETGKEILRGADGRLYLEDDPAYVPIPEPNPNQEEINELKSYLAGTDYIDNKIVEAMLAGQDAAALAEKYAAVLAEREAARAKINGLEG